MPAKKSLQRIVKRPYFLVFQNDPKMGGGLVALSIAQIVSVEPFVRPPGEKGPDLLQIETTAGSPSQPGDWVVVGTMLEFFAALMSEPA